MSTATTNNPSLLPRLPRRFGRYELIAKLGRGGCGSVYRAREIESTFPREVCVKRLLGSLERDQALALREEARVLAGVRHSNVVSLLAIDEEVGGEPYLVLELIRGFDLRLLSLALSDAALEERPARGRVPGRGLLPASLAVHVACAVLRAIGAVQRAMPGLVHRDVTPHNILISSEGEVKLADFGIALARDRIRWTRPFCIKGKLGYMSPEQIRGEPLDVRTDLFALGVTLYELVTATRPWGNGRGIGQLAAIERGGYLPVAALRPDLDRRLADVIDRLTSHRSWDRFFTADEALRALAPYSAGDLASLRLSSIVGLASTHLRPDPRVAP